MHCISKLNVSQNESTHYVIVVNIRLLSVHLVDNLETIKILETIVSEKAVSTYTLLLLTPHRTLHYATKPI